MAGALAAHFDRVEATDASAEQIRAALPHDAVTYTAAPAESTPFADASFDLVTVGQALHWFDAERFFAEVIRVAAPGGILAAWCYETCTVSDAVDSIVGHLYEDLTGPFWPPERAIIERGYRDFELPGQEIDAPAFEMALEWDTPAMLGYLRTWSACRRYREQHATDPVDLVAEALEAAWGNRSRTVRWPLRVRVSRLRE